MGRGVFPGVYRQSLPPRACACAAALALYNSYSAEQKIERSKTYHLKLSNFYRHFKPEKLNDVNSILDSWAGIEHLLMQELQIKQKYADLLQSFFCAHDEKKLSQIESTGLGVKEPGFGPTGGGRLVVPAHCCSWW